MAKQKFYKGGITQKRKKICTHFFVMHFLKAKNALALQTGRKSKDTSLVGKSKKLVARIKTVIKEQKLLKILSIK